MVEVFVFAVAAVIILGGAGGVIASRNTVHAALSLVATLFGIAVLFVAQEANFLAAVQVIVYAGAIVVLFLFVIMLLGVDQAEDLRTERLPIQRPLAAVLGLGVVGLLIAAFVATRDTEPLAVGTGLAVAGEGVTDDLLAAGLVAVVTTSTVTGVPEASSRWVRDGDDISQIGRLLFTDYLFAFEITSLLLVIAVVGAVLLARTRPGPQVDADEEVPSLPGDHRFADDHDEHADTDPEGADAS